MEERDYEGKTPSEERAEIGTPAGEAPERGRLRHGTEEMYPELETDEDVTPRDTVEDEMDYEALSESGAEISTTGGLTGTHVQGGRPAGGQVSGGTPVEPEGTRSGDYKS